MKKLQILILLIFVSSIVSLAQDKEKIKKISLTDRYIEFDFKSQNEISIPINIKEGEFYKVFVKNINLNNYRVEMLVKDTVYYSQALDFPVFGAIDISGLTNIIATFDSFEGVSEKAKELADTQKNKNFPLFFPMAEEDPDELDIDSVKAVLTAEQIILQGFKNRLDSINKVIDTLSFDFMSSRVLAKSIEIKKWNTINLEDKLKKFSSLRDTLVKVEFQSISAMKSYQDFFDLPKVIIILKEVNGVDSIRIFREKKKVEDAQSEFGKKFGETKNQISTANVEKSLVSIYQLYEICSFTSLPIQFTGEEAELKMSFIPKDSTSNLQTYHLSPIKFGRSPWYWSVGPGFYYSKLENERVGLETIQVNDSTQNFRITEENPLKGEIGISALLHAGRKFNIGSLDLGGHLNVGTGVSLGKDIQARMLYGVGLAIGKKNHLTIDVGWATGYVDRIAKQVEINGYEFVYVEKPSPLIKDLDTKNYISLGYMFSF